MIRETTYTGARKQLATLMDQVTDTREPVLIGGRGKEPVALVAASDLSSWMETEYLLRSPRNAERLRDAMARADALARGSSSNSTNSVGDWVSRKGDGRAAPGCGVCPRLLGGPARLDSDGPQADAADPQSGGGHGTRPVWGVGKPEALRGDLARRWSRRIDREHRVVYQVGAERVYYLAARYHY